jgi:hypothetical protein
MLYCKLIETVLLTYLSYHAVNYRILQTQIEFNIALSADKDTASLTYFMTAKSLHQILDG